MAVTKSTKKAAPKKTEPAVPASPAKKRTSSSRAAKEAEPAAAPAPAKKRKTSASGAKEEKAAPAKKAPAAKKETAKKPAAAAAKKTKDAAPAAKKPATKAAKAKVADETLKGTKAPTKKAATAEKKASSKKSAESATKKASKKSSEAAADKKSKTSGSKKAATKKAEKTPSPTAIKAASKRRHRVSTSERNATVAELAAQKEAAEKAAKEAARSARAARAAQRLGDFVLPEDPMDVDEDSETDGENEEAAAEGEKAAEEAAAPAEPKEKKKAEPKPVLKELPSITVTDETGASHNLKDLAAERGVVLFAYPRANTGGCTTQACGFRDHAAEFTAAGFNVYGISFDSAKSQSSWKAKHNLPYPLLTDAKAKDESALYALGATKAKGAGITRSHWVFAKGGALIDAQVQISPKESFPKALETAKANPQVEAASA